MASALASHPLQLGFPGPTRHGVETAAGEMRAPGLFEVIARSQCGYFICSSVIHLLRYCPESRWS